MRILIVSILVLVASFATAGNRVGFIDALIQVESSGNDTAVGDGGKAVGCLQIWQVVIDDVNRVYHTNYRAPDRMDRRKSIEICVKYLAFWGKRYEKKTGRKCTREILARIWNGGPNGYDKKNTVEYWNKVKMALESE